VIAARHYDPTRGPSLREFQRYKKQQECVRQRDQETIRQLRAQLDQQYGQIQIGDRDVVKKATLINELPAPAIEHKEETTKHPQQCSTPSQTALQSTQQRQQPTILSATEEVEIARLMVDDGKEQQQRQQQSSDEEEQKTTKKRKIEG
jgi:hypothetical protein